MLIFPSWPRPLLKSSSWSFYLNLYLLFFGFIYPAGTTCISTMFFSVYTRSAIKTWKIHRASARCLRENARLLSRSWNIPQCSSDVTCACAVVDVWNGGTQSHAMCECVRACVSVWLCACLPGNMLQTKNKGWIQFKNYYCLSVVKYCKVLRPQYLSF